MFSAFQVAVDSLPEAHAAAVREGKLHPEAKLGQTAGLLLRSGAGRPEVVVLDQGATVTREESDALMDSAHSLLCREAGIAPGSGAVLSLREAMMPLDEALAHQTFGFEPNITILFLHAGAIVDNPWVEYFAQSPAGSLRGPAVLLLQAKISDPSPGTLVPLGMPPAAMHNVLQSAPFLVYY